jgi:hypothetical protein
MQFRLPLGLLEAPANFDRHPVPGSYVIGPKQHVSTVSSFAVAPFDAQIKSTGGVRRRRSPLARWSTRGECYMGAHSTLLGVRQHICLLKQVRELLPCGAAYRLGISCVVASVARPISSVLKQQSESFTIGVCFGERAPHRYTWTTSLSKESSLTPSFPVASPTHWK